jgi:uncharacterized protein (DUF697 family)
MIKELAGLFNVKPTAAEIAKVLGLFVGAQFGTTAAKTLLSFLPGIGGLANGAITAAHTEAFGWIAYKYFKDNY